MARRHLLVKSAAVVALLATAASGIAMGTISGLVGNIKTQDIGKHSATKQEGPADGAPINILVMGSDTRDGQGSGFGGSHLLGFKHSDTNIIVHIAGNRDWATAVSIPRDTWVTMPDCDKADGGVSKGYTGRFNEAMQRGGPSCTIKTIETLTGLYIDHFVVVDFRGFQKVVDAVGGVQVCLTSAVNDKKSHLNLPKGLSTLDGKTALAFVRARKTLGDGSDISRIRRQQDFLASLAHKVTSKGVLFNPATLLKILNSVSSSLTTDTELGNINGMKDMAFNLRDLKLGSIRFITAPNTPNPANKNVVIFTPTADELWSSLKADIQWPKPPNNGPDGKPLTADPSDIKMAVLNGTTTKGLAGKKATLFKQLGYTVAKVANTNDAFGTETAVYATKARANDARTVAAALGLKKVITFKKANPKDPSLVVVVGTAFDDPKSLLIKTKPKSSLYGPTSGRAADETDCSPA